MTAVSLCLTMLAVGAVLAWVALPVLLMLARRAKSPMPDAREKTLLFALGAAACIVLVPFLPSRPVPGVLVDVAAPLVGKDGFAKSLPEEAHAPIAALGVIYLLAVAARLSLRLRAWLELQLQLSRSSPLPSHVQSIRDVLCRDLGIAPPPIIVSETAPLPFVTGAFVQRVVLPRELTDALSEAELTLVLRHELIHVARKDGLNALLAEVFASAFPFHPSVPGALAEIIIAREAAVDLRASAPDLRGYAKLLVHVAERHQYGPAVTSTVAMGKHALSRRLDILLEKPPHGRDRVSRMLVVAALGVLAFCAVLVPRVTEAAMSFTDGSTIHVPKGSQRRITLGPVSRIAIGDPSIADVKVLGGFELQLLGESEGHTTLLVWPKEGPRRSYLIDVH